MNKVNSGAGRASALLSIFLVLLMIASSMPVIAIMGSRTGELANEPAGGFSEGTEFFRTYHLNGVNNTTFTLGERVYINLTTNRVADLTALNRIRVYDYTFTQRINKAPAFVATDSVGPTYSYEGFFDATVGNGFTNDHYALQVQIQAAGGNRFFTQDTIMVGGGAAPPKYIKTYTDANFTNMDWVFNTNEVVYVEVWTGGTVVEGGNSNIAFADYRNNRNTRGLDTLTNTTLTVNGNYVRFAYDLATDLNTATVPLNEGWWYTIELALQDSQGNDLIRLWTIQIYINIRPSIKAVGATPSIVDVTGAATTTLYAHFSDIDAPGAGAFNVTLRVRQPNDITIVTLVNAKLNGQGGLTITDLGAGDYNATYIWDPPNNQVPGLYDIHVSVRDDKRGVGLSDFASNLDKLNLTNSNFKPITLVAGNTMAVPPAVTIAGTLVTTISSNFKDPMDTTVGNFLGSFWIRDPTNKVLLLIDGKIDGTKGNFNTTLHITRVSAGNFTASIDLDPDNTFALGLYDLYFSINDGIGRTATDPFDKNLDELEITSGNNVPAIIDVVAVPSSVDKIGNNIVTITGTFDDKDNHTVGSLLLTFEVRDPSGNPITLAKKVHNGAAGAFGNMLLVTKSNIRYTASIDWDPADTVEVGYYDLRMSVTDPNMNTNVSDFQKNLKELQVISSNRPPMIVAGDTNALPSTVIRIGTATTTISSNFTDADLPAVGSFNVTFKVRDPNGNDIVIVNDKANGGSGVLGGLLNILTQGSGYRASIVWDPADTVVVGKYDLYFSVTDAYGSKAEDSFSNNKGELDIKDPIVVPTISAGNLHAVPSTINRDTTEATTIYAEFQDTAYTTPNVFLVTIMIRDSQSFEMILADSLKNGLQGTGGGILNISRQGVVFNVSLSWDPLSSVLEGPYDLYFKVRDPVGGFAVDTYANNEDKLLLTIQYPPVITNVWADPFTLAVSGPGTTRISAEFTDQDAKGISDFKVTLSLRNPVGNDITLFKDKVNGQNGEFGGTLIVEKLGGSYFARYLWDPPETAITGSYDLKAEVTDQNTLKAESGFDLNLDKLNLTGGVPPGAPKLISNPLSNSSGKYTFSVTYIDTGNNPPDSQGVRIVLDGKEFKMTELVNDSNLPYTSGRRYFFIASLAKGTHTYSYTVKDTNGLTATTTPETVKVIKGKGGHAGASVFLNFAILLLVILVIGFILIALIMRRESSKDQRSAPTKVKMGHKDAEGPAVTKDVAKEPSTKSAPIQKEDKPAPKDEKKEESPKSEPSKTKDEIQQKPGPPKMVDKGGLKDKHGTSEAPTGTTETKHKLKDTPSKEAPESTSTKNRNLDNLEALLKGLDKK